MSTISSRVALGPVAHVIGSRSARFHRGADWPQLCTFGRVPPTWAVGDPSPFNDERELLLRRFGVQGSWSADAAECVSDDALFLLSQADHLVVLHQIHSAHAGLMFGLGPPARSLLEVNGYVFWLPHPNLGSIRTRAARALLSRLNDASRERAAAKYLGAPKQHLTGVGELINKLKARVAERFYPSEIQHDKVRPPHPAR